MVKFLNSILVGDVRKRLKDLPDESIHTVVTSPPYFNLRDYGTAKWVGGIEHCKHQLSNNKCSKCGAKRIDHQIGLESSPDAFVKALVEVFHEVKRVLRQDGICWINIGDSYYVKPQFRSADYLIKTGGNTGLNKKNARTNEKVKILDLQVGNQLLIPHRLAMALQADGWYVRSTIIWYKPSTLPESVHNRCSNCYEYIFMLTRNRKYYYDKMGFTEIATSFKSQYKYNSEQFIQGIRNARNVWMISPENSFGKHYAVMPQEIVRRCVLLSTSEKGYCKDCGEPYKRVIKARNDIRGQLSEHMKNAKEVNAFRDKHDAPNFRAHRAVARVIELIGWKRTCECKTNKITPAVVMDPFMGSGTTGLVARKLGRNYVGFELNRAYAKAAIRRIKRRFNKEGRPLNATPHPRLAKFF